MSEKITGTVEWYQPHRGFGMIIGEDKEEYFIYHTEINMEGFRQLKPNQKVRFQPNETEKGLNALDLEII